MEDVTRKLTTTIQKVQHLDYKQIDLKVGLEVHQQLSTETKLFCACPPFTGNENEEVSGSLAEFNRILRPASSELGEVDEAAQFESRHEIRVKYLASSQGSCLVEADEEPPRPITAEGVETALIFSLALSSRIIDEIHVMRKIVVDGSNTSGFQRTAVISLGGKLDYGEGKVVGVQSISLEEDAARAIKTELGRNEGSIEKAYALDRLGTPLVEVALAPLEGTPEDAEEAAKTLGRLMRSTGRIARGLGTIRQDLNISVLNGKVIEVKGVQRLDQIRRVVEFEAARQKFFHDLASEISEKAGRELAIETSDSTDVFANTESKILRKALEGGKVQCIVVKNFAGFIGKENEFHSRLGKELGAIAKSYGLGGVFHSDELPNYGITADELSLLRNVKGLEDQDAFVLIAGPEEIVAKAGRALEIRLRSSTVGVPAETRAANLEGETTFLRPRPGAARMYPETDIPLIQISKEEIERLKQQVPEPWEKQVNSFSKKYDLPRQLGEPLYDSDRKELFENVLRNTKLSSRFVASALVDTFLSLSRDGVAVDSIADEKLLEVFVAIDIGRFAKEGLNSVLRQIAGAPSLTVYEAVARAGLGNISQAELDRIVDEVIENNMDLVRSKGKSGSQSSMMGQIMQRVRGRADGKIVSETLSRRISAHLDEGKS